MVQDQYARIGRTGFGGETSQIDVPGFNHFVNKLQTGEVRPEELSRHFDTAVQNYIRDNPNDRYAKYARDFQERQERPITTMPVTSPPGGLGMGNVDPFYEQRMALDAQVNARNSQGQKATPEQLAEMRRLSELSENSPEVNARRDALNEEAQRRGTLTTFMNMGGIAALGQGGYPRRTGQISGPGTEKSDSIPAMLSDGEFVMTAKAVRGAGKGSRRAGAKQMYKLMHQLEKNAERG